MKKIISMLLLAIVVTTSIVFADVGDFESYDSDWGSDSSWDSDWSSSSSWDSGYGNYYYSDGDGIGGTGIILVIIIIFVIVAANNNKGNTLSNQTRGYNPNYNNRTAQNYNRSTYIRNSAKSEAVAEQVRNVDKFFNDEQFLTWTKNLFVKLQTAWSERDWEAIRPLESENLFEQHSKQIQGYIDRKQINKMERIAVNFAELVSFSQDNEKDILVVALNSSMTDYIVDEISGMVLKGSKDSRLTNTYKLTFIRKKGVLTEEGTNELKTTNCPNCGAPTKITSSGKCEFCGGVITIGAHDWVLGDMERYN